MSVYSYIEFGAWVLFLSYSSLNGFVAYRRIAAGRGLSSMWKPVGLLALLITVVFAVVPGWMPTWSVYSWIMKFMILFVCWLIPAIGTWVSAWLFIKIHVPLALACLAGVVLGTAVGGPLVWVAATVLMCLLTGDCP